MEQSINKILATIDEAIAGFINKIPGIQKLVYDELQPVLKEIQIKDGKILNNLNNLKLIGQLKNKLEKIIINADYKKSVSKFIESFDMVSALQLDYFKQFNKQYKPKNTLPVLRELTVEATINDLVGQGLNSNVIAGVEQILRQNITTGGDYAALQNQMRNHILTNESGEGSLERYTKQITTDAIHQYNAQYHEAIAQDLNFNWGRYIGSNITTSRELCIWLTKKEWVHKSQLSDVIKGKIDDHQCKLSNTTKLPYGVIPGTNADNFKVRRGGYNCGHQFFWVPDSAVPEDIKRNFANAGKPVVEQVPVNTKVIELKGKKDFEKIDQVQDLLLQNKEAINPFFNNTTFKTLQVTRKIGVNGLTDMNGNIALSSDKTNHIINGLNGIKNKIALTPDQEKAFATLWHEIWHNTNKANSTNITKTERRFMELGNEFVARKTLDDFFAVFKTELKDKSLKVNRNDTAYNIWVKNYDRLIAHFKADEKIVLTYMKDKMKSGDYDNVKTYLAEAIVKGVQFSKLDKKVVNKAVQDAVNYSERFFQEKYK